MHVIMIISETDEYDLDKADIINSKPKLSEIKNHLNIFIKYVKDKNISAYYEYLRHLCELIIK